MNRPVTKRDQTPSIVIEIKGEFPRRHNSGARGREFESPRSDQIASDDSRPANARRRLELALQGWERALAVQSLARTSTTVRARVPAAVIRSTRVCLACNGSWTKVSSLFSWCFLPQLNDRPCGRAAVGTGRDGSNCTGPSRSDRAALAHPLVDVRAGPRALIARLLAQACTLDETHADSARALVAESHSPTRSCRRRSPGGNCRAAKPADRARAVRHRARCCARCTAASPVPAR